MRKRKNEFETVKERNFSIRLSDVDVEYLFIKAGSVGLTVPELLENFIGDLVDGTFTNGSDERDLASQWFERCICNWNFGEYHFLQWLFESWYNVEYIVYLWNNIQSFKDDEVIEADDKEDIANWEEQLNTAFCEYLESEGASEWAIENCTIASEMEIVIKWFNTKQKAVEKSIIAKA